MEDYIVPLTGGHGAGVSIQAVLGGAWRVGGGKEEVLGGGGPRGLTPG